MSARDHYGSAVVCYGCGDMYDADPPDGSGEAATLHHSRHLGDTQIPRDRLLAWLDKCQAERDEWLRRAYGWEG